MKIILIILCLIAVIYLITVMMNAKKNKMITTPYYTWDVARNTAIRLQTFINQYYSLSGTPITKNEFLQSIAESIYELGVVKLNDKRYAKTLLDRSQHQIFKLNSIASDINIKANDGFFKTFTHEDFKKYIEKYAEQIATSIMNTNK